MKIIDETQIPATLRDVAECCDFLQGSLSIALGVLSRHMKKPEELDAARASLEGAEAKIAKLKLAFERTLNPDKP